MATQRITRTPVNGQPPIYMQIVGIDQDAKAFDFSRPIVFGNNVWLQLDRFGCPVVISGNRWQLATQLEQIAGILRGEA